MLERLGDGLALVETREGRGQVYDVVAEIECFLDIYGQQEPQVTPQVEAQIRALYEAHRLELSGGLALSLARLALVEFPISVYPWTLLRGLLSDLKPSAERRGPSRRLLAEVAAADPLAWAEFCEAAAALNSEVTRTRTWPSAQSCAHAHAQLMRLEPQWREVCARERAQLRMTSGKLKDPAVRRALEWYGLMSWTLSCVHAERAGPLYLFQDYMVGVLHYVDSKVAASAPGRLNPAACDVAVLELFALLDSWASPLDGGALNSPLTLGSRGQSQGRVRKRVQRARLNAHRVHSKLRAQGKSPSLDAQRWVLQVLPRLEAIGRAAQHD